MARVPTYQSPVIQNRPMPAPQLAPQQIDVPRGAFDTGGSGLVQAGEKVADFGNVLGQAAARIQTREDAVARAGDFSAFNEAAQNELRRLQTEADMGDMGTVKGYNAFLETKFADITSRHQGSEDSKAQLAVRLGDLRMSMSQQAADIGFQAGQKRVLNVLGEKLASVTKVASERPDSINDLFRSLDADIDDMAAAMTPEQEIEFRASARREVVLSALNGVIDRPGGVDAAADLIHGTPGIMEMLTPQQQRTIHQKFTAAEEERTRATRDARDVLVKAETILGRKPNTLERMRLAGLGGGGEASPLDKINRIEKALAACRTRAFGGVPGASAQLKGLE